MKLKLAHFLAAAAALLAMAGPAQARDIHWNVGIHAAPGVTLGVGNGYPVYAPAPVYAAPAPIYVAPPVYAAPRYYVQPAPVYYAPPVYIHGGGHRHHHRGHRHGHRGYRH
ncbi:MAG: hypothetical protein ACO1PB_04535 [Ramlibacter sp.]